MPFMALTRRRNRRAISERRDARLGLLAALLSILSIAGLGLAALVLALAGQLPDVTQIEAQFGVRGSERHVPLRIFDRTGEVELFENLHPAARDRTRDRPARTEQSIRFHYYATPGDLIIDAAEFK
jgi:hypothetical protein